jgi:hypothetical protein
MAGVGPDGVESEHCGKDKGKTKQVGFRDIPIASRQYSAMAGGGI